MRAFVGKGTILKFCIILSKKYQIFHLISEKNAVEDLKTLVLEQEVSGALLDSYVAGYWATSAPNKVLKDSNLRVGTVLDHQFAYGFVIAGELQKEETEKCMRKKLNSMETEITSTIQEKAKTMEVKKSTLITVRCVHQASEVAQRI